MRKMKDSGIEWIGEIPEAWRRTKLKNLIIESNSGEVIDRSYWNIGDEILYSCSKATIMCNYSKFPKHKRTVKGDLLLTRNATPYIFIPEENAIYTNVVQRIKLNDKVNLRFIKYMLESSRSSIKGYGDIIESFNMNVWGNTWCTIPSIEEQELIADYLDNKVKEIDNIISKTKETIEEYKQYKQSVITEAVTKGLNPNVEMKDSGIEWIGEIPKHWNLNKLKRFCKVIDGDRGAEYPNDKDLVDDGIPFISTACLGSKYINLNYAKYISQSKFEKLGNGKILENDIVISVRGSVGATSIFKSKIYNTGFINAQLMILRLNNFTEYYYNYFNSYGFLDYLSLCSYGTAQKQLSNKILSNIVVISPPIKEQIDISKYLDKKCTEIDNLISKKEQLIIQLEQYKKSLIYECVTGKKEVSVSYAD